MYIDIYGLLKSRRQFQSCSNAVWMLQWHTGCVARSRRRPYGRHMHRSATTNVTDTCPNTSCVPCWYIVAVGCWMMVIVVCKSAIFLKYFVQSGNSKCPTAKYLTNETDSDDTLLNGELLITINRTACCFTVENNSIYIVTANETRNEISKFAFDSLNENSYTICNCHILSVCEWNSCYLWLLILWSR